jgi:hypothetical protein
MPTVSKKITHSEVRMYRMGTGDCFVIKFFAGQKVTFKMMIDCGTWQGKKTELIPYITDLKTYVNNSVDLLVVTHEHKDHVYVFEACQELFTNGFVIKQTWMAWTEDEKGAVASQWLKDYGDKKKALALAANKIDKALKDPEVVKSFENDYGANKILAARQFFAGALNSFADLQFSVAKGQYVGMLKGMKIVKEQLAKGKIRYCHPGEIITNLAGAAGIKFYVLGPPLLWEEVKKESGGKGESYAHNNTLAQSDAFAAAVLGSESGNSKALLPFDQKYNADADSELLKPIKERYSSKDNSWRNIDHDWLNSAGALALRVNSMTNNLSLALAIEFEDSGRVMLFPGDAEFGSWESWHNIPWTQAATDESKGLTEDLLNRTVFYKVAHHLSHNGTAQRLGMEMMMHKDLTAMATLDYGIISTGWTGTMPNQPLLKELLTRTKGRLLVMNEKELLYDRKKGKTLTDEIKKVRSTMSAAEKAAFKKAYLEDPLFLQFTVNAK